MRAIHRIIQFFVPKLAFYIPHSTAWHLTIDDSPSIHTPYILDLLNSYNVKASFFCVGKHIEQYPEYFRAIIERGHRVGYHSYEHKNALRQTLSEFELDFEKCRTIFEADLYRPPYGKLGLLSYLIIPPYIQKIYLWDILTKDWEVLKDPLKTIQEKIKQARDGSILVFHDNEKSFENLKLMLPYFLDYCKAENKQLKPVQIH